MNEIPKAPQTDPVNFDQGLLKKPTKPPVPKTEVKKSLFRTEAIIPVFIFILLTFIYFRFLFDLHMKKVIEWGGSYIYGAEVNVGSVETSFSKLSFAMNNLQLTDKTQPSRNLVSVGAMRFALTADALLRAKFVVDDASILNIEVYTPRKHPGYVKPLAPPTRKEGPTLVDDIERKARLRIEEQNKNNIFGSLAQISGGANVKDQLKNMQGDLVAQKNITDLQKFILDKQKDWTANLAKFPQKKDYDDYVKRAKQLQFNIKNPTQFAKDVQEADKIYKEVDEKAKASQEMTTQFKADTEHIDGGLKNVNQWVQQDVENIKKKLNIPTFDPKKFSESLFMSLINEKITGAEKYITMAREYMPSKKGDSDKGMVPTTRAQGRTVTYMITKGYPLFWLKHAEITSQANMSEFSGDVSGKITDISTSPKITGKPAIIEFKGNFPTQNLTGVQAQIKLDHTQDDPKETFYMKVASYSLSNLKLVDNESLALGLKSSTAAFQFGGEVQGKKIKLALQNVFRKNDFDINTRQELVKKIMQDVFQTLPEVVLNASINGTFDELDTNVNSNLGTAMSDGFKKEIAQKFSQATQDIEASIQEKIRGPKDQLISQINKFHSDYLSKYSQKEKEAQLAAEQAKAQITKQKSGGSTPQNMLNDVKKGFKF